MVAASPHLQAFKMASATVTVRLPLRPRLNEIQVFVHKLNMNDIKNGGKGDLITVFGR